VCTNRSFLRKERYPRLKGPQSMIGPPVTQHYMCLVAEFLGVGDRAKKAEN